MRELVRGQIGLMVNDVIETTRAEVAGVIDRRRARCRPGARHYVARDAGSERRLKSFLYERLYYHPEQRATAQRAHDVIARLPLTSRITGA